MANIGVSQPYYAVYTNNNGTVTYGDLKRLGKATQVDISIDNKEPTVLYADNGPAESVTLFGGGTATMGLDELSLDVAADVLGLTVTTTENQRRLTFLADPVAPYVGLAFIIKKVTANVPVWRLVVLYKCKFQLPDYSVSTQGESVEFQTPSLDASIMRDDATPAKWSDWLDFSSEVAAQQAMRTMLPAGN